MSVRTKTGDALLPKSRTMTQALSDEMSYRWKIALTNIELILLEILKSLQTVQQTESEIRRYLVNLAKNDVRETERVFLVKKSL